MLPQFIKEDKTNKRHKKYQTGQEFYNGYFLDKFNINEQEKKINDFEYICYGVFKQAVDIKTDLIWREKPTITFTNEQTQTIFDELRANTDFDETLAVFTRNLFTQGDSILKITTDKDYSTATEDIKLNIFNINPSIWIPEYNPTNTNQYPRSQTFILEKTILKENGQKDYEAYLLETHTAGKIEWTAYQERDKKYIQVNPLEDWSDELEGVLAETKTEGLAITYNTNCLYPLIQFLQNDKDIDDFYAKNDLSLPVMSKLNSLNNYSNLADTVIVSNVFPKLLAGEKVQTLLSRIIDEANKNTVKKVIPDSLLNDPKIEFMNSRSYLKSYIWKQFVDEARILPNDPRSETKYLQNDFDLEQLRKQHDIFFKSLMTELGISEVFYNPELTTGATSGTAYKRLMSMTLNEVEHIKRKLEVFIKTLVYTMLELGNNNKLFNATPEMPEVHFGNAYQDDEKEKLELLTLKYQNELIPQLEAIKEANNIDTETAEQYLTDILQKTMDEADQNLEAETNNNQDLEDDKPRDN
jgi:hypothetical protein